MKRGAFGGQVQEAWDKAPPTAGTHQSELCDNCSYKVRLREFMVTVIELPRGEKISAYDNGDPQSFEVKQRGDNRLAVKPIGGRSEEHTSELQSLMRISYAVFCLKQQIRHQQQTKHNTSDHTKYHARVKHAPRHDIAHQ